MAVRHVLGGDFNLRSHAKGVCMGCKTGKREGDDGIWVLATDDFASYDLCETCVAEMAAAQGMVPKAKADELRANNRRYGAQIRHLENKLEAQGGLIAEFFSVDEEDEAGE